MPRHRQGHGDGSLSGSHIRRPRCAAGDWADGGTCGARRQGYRRIHSQGSPSDRHETRPSGSLHQMACYELQEVSPL